MAFTTENIETEFQKAIDAGAPLFEPLTQKPWGHKMGYARDNNAL
ncbi:MAG: lactoylglutathione lyase [Cryomorphaceae bacterium]